MWYGVITEDKELKQPTIPYMYGNLYVVNDFQNATYESVVERFQENATLLKNNAVLTVFAMDEDTVKALAMDNYKLPITAPVAYFGTVVKCVEKSKAQLHMEYNAFQNMIIKNELLPQTMNTKISYLYRDAYNYKVHNECVVKGTLTEEQIETIMDCLDCGEYFIPHKVGLTENKFGEETDADHDFFEMDSDGFEQTKEAPTAFITADALVEAFKNCKDKWEEIMPPVRGRAR